MLAGLDFGSLTDRYSRLLFAYHQTKTSSAHELGAMI